MSQIFCGKHKLQRLEFAVYICSEYSEELLLERKNTDLSLGVKRKIKFLTQRICKGKL